MTSTSPATFVWAFQKRSTSDAVDTDYDQTSTSQLRDDYARIYLVEVTNPRSGGAEKCKVCPQGASQDGYNNRFSEDRRRIIPRKPEVDMLWE